MIKEEKKKILRSRAYCYTLNNYTPEELENCRKIICKYQIIGREKGLMETPHLQGYIYFNSVKSFDQVKIMLGPRAHIEVAKGSPQQNRDYCSKDHKFEEFGELPVKGKRNDLIKIAKQVREEGALKTIEDNPEFALLNTKKIIEYDLQMQLKKFNPFEFKKRNVIWCYGPTGTGKTKYTFEQCSGKKTVRLTNDISGVKWFQGVDLHTECVIFDDFRAGDIKFNFLLQLLDGRALQVQIKGGFTLWNPDYVYFTSPDDPVATYRGTTEQIQQLLRRITMVLRFSSIESEPESIDINSLKINFLN